MKIIHMLNNYQKEQQEDSMSAQSASVHEIQTEFNVPIPMRDGIVLRADVYRPIAAGQYPVLVERVAYERIGRCQKNGEYHASRGYVFVAQSVRGCFGSEGAFNFCLDDAWGANRDGYDTVEWAASQPWSTGKVGLFGGSYSGGTQYMAAPTRPPHLTALYVREGFSDTYRDASFRDGAYYLHVGLYWNMQTMLSHLRHESAPPGMDAARKRLEKALEEIDSWYNHLPLNHCPPLEGIADEHFEMLTHPEDGPYWWPRNMQLKFAEIDTPMFHLGGWFDIFLDSTLRSFQGTRTQGRTARCRQSQRLLIGPWVHGPGNVGKREVGELDFGPQAEFDLHAHRLQWYDHWLKDADNAVADWPPVRVFLMGADRWLDLPTWPPEGIVSTPLYLRAGDGPGTESLNNGRLTFDPPASAEHPDSFAYDPADPVPSLILYPELGPTDHHPVESRMLTYTTAPLERDLTVAGPVKAVLHALSSAPDTDWVARLCDVWPDGRSLSVCDGILRARYRSSLERAELMQPGQLYRFEIDLWSTAQVFKAGHCLRLQIASSDFPRYDRNLNTGGPFAREVCGQTALNTVFHDSLRPSHLLLPVLENPA